MWKINLEQRKLERLRVWGRRLFYRNEAEIIAMKCPDGTKP